VEHQTNHNSTRLTEQSFVVAAVVEFVVVAAAVAVVDNYFGKLAHFELVVAAVGRTVVVGNY